MWLYKRTGDKSLLISRIDQSLQDEAAAILDAGNVTHVRKPKTVRMVVDKDMIEKNAELFTNLAVPTTCSAGGFGADTASEKVVGRWGLSVSPTATALRPRGSAFVDRD